MSLLAEAAQHAPTAAPQSLLYTLIGAAVVLVPAVIGLAYRAWRDTKRGPGEERELVARLAQEATEAAKNMLDAARDERSDLVAKVDRLEARVDELEDSAAVTCAERQHDTRRIAELEQTERRLTAEVASLREGVQG